MVAPVAAQVRVVTAQLSLKVGLESDTALLHVLVVVVEITLHGQVIVGFILSITVMVWVQEAELPKTSVTVQSTLLIPMLYTGEG